MHVRVWMGACKRARCRGSGKVCEKGWEIIKEAGRGQKNLGEDENKGGREMERGSQLASKGVGRG